MWRRRCTTSSTTRRCPAPASTRTASGPASTRWSPTSPQNQDLLARRDELQAQIDKWHRQRIIGGIDAGEYKQFLTDIGYLQPEPADFTITTSGVDDEITTTAGPQLVVPILNARFALNAANARWGSLYDALYGTDVIGEDDGADEGPAATTKFAATRSSRTPAVPRRGGAAGQRVVDRRDRPVGGRG